MTDTCPNCGITYRDFRTGETFRSIKDSLWVASDDPADWKYKRKGTVLGRWYQLKQEMWEHHITNCQDTEISEYCTCADY